MKHGRLIDAEKLKAHYAWWENGSEEYQQFKNLFDQIIDAQPTVGMSATNKHQRNERIRSALRIYDIKMWELADMLGIHEVTLSRKLRTELSPDETEEILRTIKMAKKAMEENDD